jgi:hypothetical protein
MFGFGHQTAILRGDGVDMSDAEILGHVPSLQLPEIRLFSYPAAFYEHVRSSLSHEWKLSPKAGGVPMTQLPAGVSYVNRVDNTNMAMSKRLIYFHVDWIAAIARSIARNTASIMIESARPPQPNVWWLEES